jgi:phosphoribosylamine---glycine ligase
LASEGYPGAYEGGRTIEIPEALEADDLRVYHAGTARRNGQLVTGGGRVLGIVGLGPDVASAGRRSREGAAAVRFEGKVWRRDIGWHEGAGEVESAGDASEAARREAPDRPGIPG